MENENVSRGGLLLSWHKLHLQTRWSHNIVFNLPSET